MNLSEDMAEFIGIMLGDGYLCFFIDTNRKRYYVNISGSLSEDLDYHTDHIHPLFYSLFKEKLKLRKFRVDEIDSRKDSKLIVTYLVNTLNLTPGPKTNCRVPNYIFDSNKQTRCAFLRGLADTDFSLMFKNKNKKSWSYPVIKIGFKSKLFVKDLEILLRNLGFKFGKITDEKTYDKRTKKTYYKSCIYIYGVNNLELWMGLIGFKNDRHLTKYKIWKKYGYCPKNLTLAERKQMLT